MLKMAHSSFSKGPFDEIGGQWIEHCLIPFYTFANRADTDQAALVRAASSGSTLFSNGNMKGTLA